MNSFLLIEYIYITDVYELLITQFRNVIRTFIDSVWHIYLQIILIYCINLYYKYSKYYNYLDS